MSQLSISLIQTDIHWENTSANLASIEELLWRHDTGDLIILPEMFNTGFTMNVEAVAEPMNLTTFKWMRFQAAQQQAVVVGSMIIRENQQYYNRLLWFFPDGNSGYYDKAYPFRMMDEHKYFSSGKERKTLEWKGFKILPLICYDLRFPEWARNAYDEAGETFLYDLLIYVGNWPATRITAWNTLLMARAMENSAYVAAVNRVGEDANGVVFNGHSALIDPRGRYLNEPNETATIQTIEIDKASLDRYREKFPVHLDW